jgi:hypothetical protein
MVMAIILPRQNASFRYPRPHTVVVLFVTSVCVKSRKITEKFCITSYQFILPALLSEMQNTIEGKTFFIRITLGLSEAAVQSLARAHGMRS